MCAVGNTAVDIIISKSHYLYTEATKQQQFADKNAKV
jgi:hypothetical protein